MGVAQTTARILLSGSPFVRAFNVIEKFMSNISPSPLSLDRIRDTRITIVTGRGGVVTGRSLPMKKREERWTPREMRPLLDHKRWSPMYRKIDWTENK